MTSVVDVLAARLPAGLVHPGDPSTGRPAQPLPLPGLSTTGIPPEMAEHFAHEAGLPHSDAPRLVAEAIMHLITGELDSTIIGNDDLEQLRAAAEAAPDRTRIIAVHTNCDRRRANPILELTVAKTSDTTVIPCRALKALLMRNPDCPHGAGS